MITRDVQEDIAEVDFTDDCRVKLWLRKRRMTLTIAEARLLRAELDAAIAEAAKGADELLHEHELAAVDVLHVHPECAAGKCGNCEGFTLTVTDVWVPCDHGCHEAVAA